jgi:hypothetical protein
MTEGIETLDELLSDPMVQLVMTRDRVEPEEIRLLLKHALPCRRPTSSRRAGCSGCACRIVAT